MSEKTIHFAQVEFGRVRTASLSGRVTARQVKFGGSCPMAYAKVIRKGERRSWVIGHASRPVGVGLSEADAIASLLHAHTRRREAARVAHEKALAECECVRAALGDN